MRVRRHDRRVSARTLLPVAALIAIAAMASPRPARDLLLYNHSPSVAPGLYVRVRAPPTLYALVTVRAVDVAPGEARRRRYDEPGDRFIKRVAALAGDRVCAEGARITINGALAATRQARDSHGQMLGHWEGCLLLAADQVLLLGDTADSYDGRYWGPVDSAQIEGVWRRLWPHGDKRRARRHGQLRKAARTA
jgi:type IV secretory pathway protease TraF